MWCETRKRETRNEKNMKYGKRRSGQLRIYVKTHVLQNSMILFNDLQVRACSLNPTKKGCRIIISCRRFSVNYRRLEGFVEINWTIKKELSVGKLLIQFGFL